MILFEPLDISGDAGIRAFGRDLPELFVNAGIGMYSLITDLREIQGNKTVNISAQGSSLEGLLVSFLNELIFHFDTYGFIGKIITIKGFQADKTASMQVYELNAVLRGDEFDSLIHEGKLMLKAATYHKLKIDRIEDHWEAEVVFDI